MHYWFTFMHLHAAYIVTNMTKTDIFGSALQLYMYIGLYNTQGIINPRGYYEYQT